MFIIGNSSGNHAVRITVYPDIGKEYTVSMLTNGSIEEVEEEVDAFVDDNLKFVDHYTYEVIG